MPDVQLVITYSAREEGWALVKPGDLLRIRHDSLGGYFL